MATLPIPLLKLTISSLCFVIHVLNIFLECPTKGFTSSARKYSLDLRPHERPIKKLYSFLFFIFVGSFFFLFCAMLQDFKHLVCDARDVCGQGERGGAGMVAGQKGVATLTTCHIPVGAHFVLQHFYAFRSANISHSRTQWRGNGSGLKAKGP